MLHVSDINICLLFTFTVDGQKPYGPLEDLNTCGTHHLL